MRSPGDRRPAARPRRPRGARVHRRADGRLPRRGLSAPAARPAGPRRRAPPGSAPRTGPPAPATGWRCSSAPDRLGGAAGSLTVAGVRGRPGQPPPAPDDRAAHPGRAAPRCSATTCSGARATGASAWATAGSRSRCAPPTCCAGCRPRMALGAVRDMALAPAAPPARRHLRRGAARRPRPHDLRALLLPLRAQDLGRASPSELSGEQARRRVAARSPGAHRCGGCWRAAPRASGPSSTPGAATASSWEALAAARPRAAGAESSPAPR